MRMQSACHAMPRVKFGLAIFATDLTPDPAELGPDGRGARLRVALLPRAHPHPGEPRDAATRRAAICRTSTRHLYDPFVACTAAAAATERLKVGTGICLVVQRDPITTAKEVASVDRLSGGRFLFGVGAGWNLEEMRNHGTDPSKRFGLLRERVEAMKAIWTEDEPEYHGRHVDFDPIWSWPKPVQEPHPPVLLGGHGRNGGRPRARVRRRVVPQPLRRRATS